MGKFVCLAVASLLIGSVAAHAFDCKEAMTFDQPEMKYRSPELINVLAEYRRITQEIFDHEDLLHGDDDLWDSLFGEGGGRPLTSEERALLKRDIDALYAQKKILEEELDRLTKQDHERLSRMLAEQYNDPKSRPLLQEFGQFLEISRLRSEELVPVLLGAEDHPPTPDEEEVYTDLVAGLVARNLTILYDADSQAAPLISSLAKKNAIGITSRNDFTQAAHGGKVFHFNNPYTVLDIFGLGRAPIISYDSAPGLALAINDQVRFVLDPRKRFENTLYYWAKKLPGKNSLSLYYQKISLQSSAEKILDADSEKKSSPGKLYPQLVGPSLQTSELQFNPSHFNFTELEGLMEYRDSVLEGSRLLDRVGGAVIFGSNQLKRDLSDEVYRLGYWFGQRGFPVVTGGSGGVMLAANMGAFDAGGDSIGIPRVGSERPKHETLIPTEVHTQTILTKDYHARISLLIKNRKVVVIEPGGNGTMRELATTLIAMRHSANPPVLIIQNKNYYQPLIKFLTTSALPEKMKQHIYFAEDSREVTEVIQNIAKTDTSFPKVKWKKPRNGRQAVPQEYFEKQSDK